MHPDTTDMHYLIISFFMTSAFACIPIVSLLTLELVLTNYSNNKTQFISVNIFNIFFYLCTNPICTKHIYLSDVNISTYHQDPLMWRWALIIFRDASISRRPGWQIDLLPQGTPSLLIRTVIEDPLECMVKCFINIFWIFRVDNVHVKNF